MSSRLDKAIKDFIQIIREAGNKGTSPLDAQAEVLRIDEDGTAWVHLPGGVDETPVKLTINAEVGDKVYVRLSGGRAWITGNQTAPPTDDKTAITAKSLANIAGNRAKAAQKVADQAQIVANSALKGTKENAAQMAQMVIDFNGDIENLQDQIDGNISTWFYDVDPAMNLPPVTDWDTDEKKDAHLGDIYYNTVKGYAWRFMKSGSTYSWERITDTDVTKALADAAKAQDTADSKRRVFYNTPTVPYDTGDLWVQGSGGDILRCAQAKTSTGSYDRNDWVLASKYTDNSALNTWIEGDFATTIQGLEDGLADAKVETYYQTTDPSTGWSDTQKSEHKGDLWYNSTASVQKYYRWSGTAWQELTATPPQAVFDSIDKKATIYTGTTTPTNPDSGDLWFKGANEPILTYVDNSWVEYNKYTDDSAVNNLKIGGANIIQDVSKWYISPNYGFINKANAHENLIARKNDNIFRADGVVNSGVTFTRIDGSNTAWHIEGTATATIDYVVTGTDKESYALPVNIGTYTLSKTIKNNSGDEPQVMISVSNSSMAYKTQYNTNGNSVTFTTPTDAKYWRYCAIRLVSGKTYNCDVYIKLESGSSATPYSIAPSDLENDADTVVLTKRATANWSNNIKPYPIIKMSDVWGKDLTLSFDWKATSDTEQPSLGFYTFKDAMMPNIWGVAGAYNMPRIANLVVGSKVGGYIVNLENNKISSNWTRCVVTFRIDSADWFTTGSELYDYFGFNIVSYYGSTENTLYIKNAKLEIGNKATSWTPAPEDVDEGIANAQTSADNAQADIDNLEIGGRNLLLDSSFTDVNKWFLYGADYPENVALTHSADGGKMEVIETRDDPLSAYFFVNLGNNYAQLSTEFRKHIQGGVWLTISCDVKINFDTDGQDILTFDFRPIDNYAIKRYVRAYFPQNMPKNTWVRIKGSAYVDEITDVTIGKNLLSIQLISDAGRTVGSVVEYRNIKLEIGNKATDWTPAPEDVDEGIKNAAKTATNYIHSDTTNGLVVNNNQNVGVGYDIQLKADGSNTGMNIRQDGNILASFLQNSVSLGKNSINSKVAMCGDKGGVSASFGYYIDSVTSNNAEMGSTLSFDFNETTFKNKVGKTTGFYEFTYTSAGGWKLFDPVNDTSYTVTLSQYGITMKTPTSSIKDHAGITINYVLDGSVKFYNADISNPVRKLELEMAENPSSSESDFANITIERQSGTYASGDGKEHSIITMMTLHEFANVATLQLFDDEISLDATHLHLTSTHGEGSIHLNGDTYINGIPIQGCHTIATSKTGAAGSYTYNSLGWYMHSGQTAYLEEKISDQQNGIILVWSFYNGEVKDWGWNFTVIPKPFLTDNPGGSGMSTFMAENSALGNVGAKYIYVRDDRIIGNDTNGKAGTGASAIKYNNNKFVLRWVYGF